MEWDTGAQTAEYAEYAEAKKSCRLDAHLVRAQFSSSVRLCFGVVCVFRGPKSLCPAWEHRCAPVPESFGSRRLRPRNTPNTRKQSDPADWTPILRASSALPQSVRASGWSVCSVVPSPCVPPETTAVRPPRVVRKLEAQTAEYAEYAEAKKSCRLDAHLVRERRSSSVRLCFSVVCVFRGPESVCPA